MNTVAPVASGLVVIGGSLSTTDGTWTGAPAPTFTYQWRRAGSNIGAATASTYTPVAADIGPAIDCVVTATNAVGSASQDSNDLVYSPTTATAVVDWWDPAAVAGVLASYTGSRAGTVLTSTGSVIAAATSLNGTPGVTFAASKVSGNMNLSALQAVRLVFAAVDTAATVQAVYGFGSPLGVVPGFDLLVNDAGVTFQPFTLGGGTTGGVNEATITLAAATQVSVGHNTAQGGGNGIAFVRATGATLGTANALTGCSAGNFSNTGPLVFGNSNDVVAAWAGTLGVFIMMSGTAIDNDLLSAEAFVKFRSGL